MRIGLIDCDAKNQKNPFPNLALMKISAWHKKEGDSVEWYSQMFASATYGFRPNGNPFYYDIVYVSKVFSFSPVPEYPVIGAVIRTGGSGFAISVIDGKEVYDKSKDIPLPNEIEHIYPDYSIYGKEDTAYGFISRGCP